MIESGLINLLKEYRYKYAMQYYKILNDDVTNPLLGYEKELLQIKEKLRSVGSCNEKAEDMLSRNNLKGKCHSIEISNFPTLFTEMKKFCKKLDFNVKWNKSTFCLIEKDGWMPWHHDASGEEGGILIPLENYANNHKIKTYWKDNEIKRSYTRKMNDNFFCLTKNYKTKNLIIHKTSKMPIDYFNVRISLGSINNLLKEN